MSYISALGIFLLVLSPLLVPLTISAVHAVADWRRHLEGLRTVIGRKTRAITPPVHEEALRRNDGLTRASRSALSPSAAIRMSAAREN
jgi:hypothetical protein